MATASIETGWREALRELDHEMAMGKAVQARAVMYRDGMPLTRISEDDYPVPAPKGPRERVVTSGDAVEVMCEMSREEGLRPLLCFSLDAARKWAAHPQIRKQTRTDAEGGVLFRTNAWNGLRPVRVNEDQLMMARLLGEPVDLPMSNRDLAEDEACVVPGVKVIRTLKGELCAVSKTDFEVLAYPNIGRGGVSQHLGLVFQTAQMYGKDAIVLCIDRNILSNQDAYRAYKEEVANAVRNRSFRAIVAVVPPGQQNLLSAHEKTRQQVQPQVQDQTQAQPQQVQTQTQPDELEDFFAAMQGGPGRLSEPRRHTLPEPPRSDHHCTGPSSPHPSPYHSPHPSHPPSPLAHCCPPSKVLPKIILEVRTGSAAADLDDRLDDWEFGGGALRTFPALPSSAVLGNGDNTPPVDCPSQRGKGSAVAPKDRQVSVRLVRQLSRMLLATLATRRIAQNIGYISSSMTVDAPMSQFYLEVRACAQN